MAPLRRFTRPYIGCFTCCSKTGLRGRNHSRLLLRASERKNCKDSAEKPGNADDTDTSLIIEVMLITEEARARFAGIPNLTVSESTPLARYTRFGIGGPADLYAETGSVEAFIAAMEAARETGIPTMVIGDGTNLIVSDHGFRGLVLRYRGEALLAADGRVVAQAGVVLQDLVDFTIERGLKGLETLTGIPGSVGAAVYGNAGAYGHSISELVVKVQFYDGECVRVFGNGECEFHYRESTFKRHKEWIVFSAQLWMDRAEAAVLR